MKLEELAKEKLKAEDTTTKFQGLITQVVGELNSGIPLSVGKRIINDIWGEGLDASKLIAKLSSSFPENNSNVLRNATLPEELVRSVYYFNSDTSSYMMFCFKYIEETIPKVIEMFLKCPSDDIIGVELAANFRKESLRFMDAISYGDFSDIDVANLDKWGEFQSLYISTGVEEGNYLFIVDFVEEMKSVGQKAIFRREKALEEIPEYVTLSNVNYDLSKELGYIKLAYLYCDYLETLANVE